MPVHLFDPTSWASPSSSTPGADLVIGNRFNVSATVAVTGIRWWGAAGNVGGAKPKSLELWRSDGTLLGATASVPDDTTAGWKDVPLPNAVNLVTGETYVVTAWWPANVSWFWLPRANVAAPPTGYAWDADIRAYGAVSADVYPANHDNALAWGVDVTTGGSTGGGGTGATSADIQNALADWFDPTDATKPTSQAKLYPDVVTAVNTKIARDGVTWDAKLGPLQTYGDVSTHGISAGVEIVRGAVADVRANLPSTAGLATTTQVNAARDAVNTHTDAEIGNLSAHIDGLSVHADAVAAADTAAIQAAIGDHDSADAQRINDLATALDAARAVINAHTDEAQTAITDAITAHDTEVDGEIAAAQTAINLHNDAARAVINAHTDEAQTAITDAITAHDTEVDGEIAAVQTAINLHTDAARAVINAHTDEAQTAITDAITAHDTEVDGEIAAAQTAINLHTDAATATITANTDANANGVAASVFSAQTAIIAAETAEHAALTALITGETGVLAVVTAIASAIAALAGVVADALTILNFLRGGSATAHQVAAGDFAGPVAQFSHAGDYFEVEITAWPVRQGAVAFPVGTWLPRIGWCAPLYGAAYGQQQRLNFGVQRVYAQAGCTGLIIYTKAGVQGHTRAYQAS